MINNITWKLFLIAFVVFILTDMIWIGLIAKNLYLQSYQPWLRMVSGQLSPLWWATLMVYLLFALSVVVFILPLSNHSPLWASIYGAFLGAIIYGVYDFTCLAIFKDFPVSMGFFDWLWGTVLCSWSSFLTIYCGGYLK